MNKTDPDNITCDEVKLLAFSQEEIKDFNKSLSRATYTRGLGKAFKKVKRRIENMCLVSPFETIKKYKTHIDKATQDSFGEMIKEPDILGMF